MQQCHCRNTELLCPKSTKNVRQPIRFYNELPVPCFILNYIYLVWVYCVCVHVHTCTCLCMWLCVCMHSEKVAGVCCLLPLCESWLRAPDPVPEVSSHQTIWQHFFLPYKAVLLELPIKIIIFQLIIYALYQATLMHTWFISQFIGNVFSFSTFSTILVIGLIYIVLILQRYILFTLIVFKDFFHEIMANALPVSPKIIMLFPSSIFICYIVFMI